MGKQKAELTSAGHGRTSRGPAAEPSKSVGWTSPWRGAVTASGTARTLARRVGDQRARRILAPPDPGDTPRAVRPKLAINTPGDAYEQEADGVADAVVAPGKEGSATSIVTPVAPVAPGTLQRQAGPTPAQLLNTFASRPRTREPRSVVKPDVNTFYSLGGSEYERERDRPGASVSSIQAQGWTYEFVVDNSSEWESIFVRASQDGTQIVNYWQKGSVATPEIRLGVASTTGAVWMEGTEKFDYQSPGFKKLYRELDDVVEQISQAPFASPEFPGAKLVSLTNFTITLVGENSPLNAKRANTMKQDLVARGARAGRISIQYDGSAGGTGVLVQADYSF